MLFIISSSFNPLISFPSTILSISNKRMTTTIISINLNTPYIMFLTVGFTHPIIVTNIPNPPNKPQYLYAVGFLSFLIAAHVSEHFDTKL